MRIAEKHVGAAAVAGGHGGSEQLAFDAGELVERHVIGHFDQNIDILRDRLGCDERTEQGNAAVVSWRGLRFAVPHPRFVGIR